jgi:RNA polymerase sigma-70 factor (ECF subfamily)
VQSLAAKPLQIEPEPLQAEPNPSFPRLILYSKLSDSELVDKATNGDRRALDALVERYSPRVNRLASQLIGDLEEARDAAQESLVKVCTRLKQFRGEAQFATWLHRLVVNTCRDRMAFQRVRRAEPLELDEHAVADDADPSNAAVLTDLRHDLADALSRLSADQRIAVVLRDSFGLSYKEISRVARMPVGTAKCYVHRARARLRTLLEEYTPA